MKSQRERILDYLLKGKTLTPIQALKKFGCFRLGARIWELREKTPYYFIESETVDVNGKRFSKYGFHEALKNK